MKRPTSFRRAGHSMLAIAVPLLAGCGGGAPARHAAPSIPVRVAKVARVDAPVTLLASGVVEPVQTVAVTPQVTGVLLEVGFHEGDYVHTGQVLFRIDPRPLQAAVEQARANLRRDQAQAAAGRRDDARYAELARLGYVPRSQADQIHATALAQAATVQADRAVLKGALLNLGYATIRAPIEGRTGSLLVRQGNLVSPGSGALVVINQVRPVLVRFPVLAQDFRSLRDAVAVHPLRVTAVPSDSSGEMEFGTLSFLDNAVDSLTGTITAKARFPNPAMRLWPGELVFLTVHVRLLRDVLAVPNAAIQLGQQGSYVYVVTANDVARMRPVVTGLATSHYTVVTSGLAAGEVVVVDGQSRLNPGARVTILTSPAAAPPEVAAGPGTPPTGYVPGLTPGRAGPSGSAAGGAAAGAPVGVGGTGAAATGTAPTSGTGTAGVGTGGVAAGARGAGQATGAAVPVTPSTPAPSTGSVTAPAPATTMTPPTVPPPTPVTPPTPQAPPATAPITAPTPGSRTGGTSGTGTTGTTRP